MVETVLLLGVCWLGVSVGVLRFLAVRVPYPSAPILAVVDTVDWGRYEAEMGERK